MRRQLFFFLFLGLGLALGLSSCAPSIYSTVGVGAPHPYHGYGPRYYGPRYYEPRPIIIVPAPRPYYRGGWSGDRGFRGGYYGRRGY